jgi:hypothetical protein
MTYFKVINQSIFNSTETYIAHQCNCTSVNAKTLAETIFKVYPQADTYSKRLRGIQATYSKPGTIDVVGNIINMYAQYYPSTAKYSNDSKDKRVIWFKSCLNHIALIPNIKNQSIAMPYNIGCAAAGGDWPTYSKMIEEFANKNQIHVTLYKI